ncbi:MAG: thiamine-phosphate kinase [Bacteroidota bacterium]
MQVINPILENNLIDSLIRSFPRSTLQLNKPHESDAELVRIPGTDAIIAITTDSICEEIERGLYTDPYLIGYMIITINVSDLAAVGAVPIGLVLNHTLTHKLSDDFLEKLNQGITDACLKYSVSILGGDTNFSTRLQVSATAIGYCSTDRVLSRKGCRVGDILFSSGRLGNGNVFAFQQLGNESKSEIEYRPTARIREGAIVSKYASSCIDTSDGCMAAVDQLMRVNAVGAKITTSMNDYLSESSIQLCRQHSLPEWYMLAGPHGEFELLFTIPSVAVEKFMEHAHSADWQPIVLGVMTEEQKITLQYRNDFVSFNTEHIRNICFGDHGDLHYYLSEFKKLEQTLEGGIS